MRIHQDARLYVGLFDGAEQAELKLAPGRLAWVHLARGTLTVNGHAMTAGDGLALQDEPAVVLGQGSGAEVLVFDMAPGA